MCVRRRSPKKIEQVVPFTGKIVLQAESEIIEDVGASVLLVRLSVTVVFSSTLSRPAARLCLLKPQPPLVILLHPQVGNMLVARGHAGRVALGHVNHAVVGHDGGFFIDRHDAQIVA